MNVNDTGARLRQDLVEEAYQALRGALADNYEIQTRDLSVAAYAVVARLEDVATMHRRTRPAVVSRPSVTEKPARGTTSRPRMTDGCGPEHTYRGSCEYADWSTY